MASVALSPNGTQPTGMRAFFVVWFGQLISLFGSALTQFALTYWVWLETGEATALSLAAFFNFAPQILLSPFAGAIVDRGNRKLIMMISDIGAGVATVSLFVLLSFNLLEIWHIYVAGAFASAFQAFQFPAYSASVTLMLPKEQYARASGMLAMAQSASQVFAPALAGALIVFIGIRGVMLIDIVTFVAAVLALWVVFIPQPTTPPDTPKNSFLKDSWYGFQYILDRPSLLGLQLMFFLANLFGSFFIVLMPALILARTGNDELVLGSVQSFVGIGGLLGGLAISVWGGPKRRVNGVLLGMFVVSAFGQLPFGLTHSILVWIVATFIMFFAINILNASNQAIWQAKVAPELQGRVFAARRLIAQVTLPLAAVISGPLADWVFEPLMRYTGFLPLSGNEPLVSLVEPLLRPENPIADLFGAVVGYGDGVGMGLLIALTGALGAVAALCGYLIPVIRNAEDILPDHDAVGEAPEPPPDLDPTGGAVVTDGLPVPNPA